MASSNYLSGASLAFEAYEKIVEHQIANGARFSVDGTGMSSPSLCDGPEDIKVEGLIVGGTTGEGHLLSWDEHLNLIAHTKDSLITSALLRFLLHA